MTNFTAFTIKSNGGFLNTLISQLQVSPHGERRPRMLSAIWDTGATGFSISKRIADELGLIPTGMTKVHTANGIADQK